MSTSPATIKHCNSCGYDVSALKRWKDADGRYFCDRCWNSQAALNRLRQQDESWQRLEAIEAVITNAPQPEERSPNSRACARCRAIVPILQLKNMNGKYLCLSCYSAASLKNEHSCLDRRREPYEKAEVFGFSIWGFLFVCLLLLMGLVVVLSESPGSSKEVVGMHVEPSNSNVLQDLTSHPQSQDSEAREAAEQRRREEMASAEQAEQLRREKVAKDEAGRKKAEEPIRLALIEYGMAKAYLDSVEIFAKSQEDLGQSIADNMGATGRLDQSTLNKINDDVYKAKLELEEARKKTLESLERLKSFDPILLTKVAREIIGDRTVDRTVRFAISGITP